MVCILFYTLFCKLQCYVFVTGLFTHCPVNFSCKYISRGYLHTVRYISVYCIYHVIYTLYSATQLYIYIMRLFTHCTVNYRCIFIKFTPYEIYPRIRCTPTCIPHIRCAPVSDLPPYHMYPHMRFTSYQMYPPYNPSD